MSELVKKQTGITNRSSYFMKNFVIAVFAILIFLIGLLAVLCEIFSLLDPEGVEKPVLYFFGVIAVVSFPLSWFLWKLSRQI